MTTYLRFPQIRHRTGLSRTTIWRLERTGEFPQRHFLTPSGSAVGWLESDVTAWLVNRPVYTHKSAQENK